MDETIKKFTDELLKEFEAQMATPEFKEFVEKTKAASDSGSFEVVISTADIDRQGESIDQNGWDLEPYKKNPVVLWGHDYWSLPIGITESIEVSDGKLIAKGRFAPAEANPFAQQVRQLYDLKIVRATSVGFIVKEAQAATITKAELLEFSFVPVPANPYALSLSQAKFLDLEMIAAKGMKLEAKVAEGDACTTDDGKEGTMKPDADGNLVCMPKEEEKAKSPACRQEGETEEECRSRKIPELIKEGMDQDQAVAAAIEICKTSCDEKGKSNKKDTEKIGVILTQMQSAIDNTIVESSRQILDVIASEYGDDDEKSIAVKLHAMLEILKTIKLTLEEKEAITNAIKEFMQAIAAAGTNAGGGEGEEHRDGGEPEQRSNDAGVDQVIKNFDEFMMTRRLLRKIVTEASNALERMNSKVREGRVHR